MSPAREQFYRVVNLMLSLANNAEFVDAPDNIDHSTKARILRNGLVVSGFSLLEKYLRDRLDELVPQLTGARIQYRHMPDKIRDFFVIDAIQGIANRVSFIDKGDKRVFIEQNIASISAFLNNPSEFTAFGFAPRGSNVGYEDIGKLISLFGVRGGWDNLSRIAADVGMSRLDLTQDFKNFSRDRNKAAHDVTTNVPSNDLLSHLQTALILGMSIDIFMTKIFSIFVKAPSVGRFSDLTRSIQFRCIFLDLQADGRVREYGHGARRAARIHSDIQSAKHRAVVRGGYDYVLVRDLRFLPVELV